MRRTSIHFNNATIKDGLLGCAIFALAFFLAWTVYNNDASFPQYYQRNFTPALSLAEGHGFANYKIPEDHPANNFLDLYGSTEDSLDSAILRYQAHKYDTPPPLKLNTLPPLPLTRYQINNYYLLWTTGIAWKILGISWANVGIVLGFLAGISAVFAHFTSRLFLGRWASLACVLLLLFSSNYLQNIIHIRDFSKTPFLYAGIYSSLVMVFRSPSFRQKLLIACATGLMLGFGMGFRPDPLITVPIFLLSTLIFSKQPLRNIGLNSVVCIIFITALMVTWHPIRTLAKGRGAIAHVICLGQTTPFNSGYGEPIYDVGPSYQDSLIKSVFNRYAKSKYKMRIEYGNKDYEKYGKYYLKDLFILVPADFLTRAYGSTIKTLGTGFMGSVITLKTNNYIESIFERLINVVASAKEFGSRHIEHIGIASFAVCIVAIMYSSPGKGVFILLALAAIGLSNSLQHQNRHCFQYELYVLISIICTASIVTNFIVKAVRRHTKTSFREVSLRFGKVLGIFIAIAIALVATQYTLRNIQHKHVAELIGQLQSERTIPIAYSAEHYKKHTAITFPELSENQFIYLVVQFKDNFTPAGSFSVIESWEKSQQTQVQYKIVNGTRSFFTPIFSPGRARIVIPNCLYSVIRSFQILADPRHVPLQFSVAATDQFIPNNYHLSLSDTSSKNNPKLYGDSASCCVALTQGTITKETFQTVYMPDQATYEQGAISYKGSTETQSRYLLIGKSVLLSAGTNLEVYGKINDESITIGILDGNQQWHKTANTMNNGYFSCTLSVREDGEYTPVIAANSKSLHTDFSLYSLKWAP